MNERIRGLLNEATVGLEPDLSPQRTVTLNEMEKFARLIVKECAEVVKWTPSMFPNNTIIKNIKEHFGIAE